MQTTVPENLLIVTATSTTLSTYIDLSGKTLEALVFPDIDGTAVTFQAALPNTQGNSQIPSSTWLPIVNSAGTAYQLTIADNTWQVVDHDVFVGVRWLRLVFGTVQTGNRTITAMVSRDR